MRLVRLFAAVGQTAIVELDPMKRPFLIFKHASAFRAASVLIARHTTFQTLDI